MYRASDVQERYGYDPRLFDLSRIPAWEGFVQAMDYCMMKQFCALEQGGRMAVLVGDIKRGRLFSMLFELTKPGVLENVIIKTQHNCMSDQRVYSGRFIPIVHEYVLLVRRRRAAGGFADDDLPGSKRHPGYARSQHGGHRCPAYWRIMAGSASLEDIYRHVETHKRAQSQQWWKEKVRQTLQINPQTFEHTGQGNVAADIVTNIVEEIKILWTFYELKE